MKKKLLFLSMALFISGFLLLACDEENDYSSRGDENGVAAQEDDAAESEAALEELLSKSNEELKALVEARHEADESPIEAEMAHDDMLADDIITRSYPTLGATLQYDNVNPETSSCKNTAKTVKSVNIYGSDFCNNKYLGTLDLRYSTNCRTVWARLRAVSGNLYDPGNWEGPFCSIHRNSDGKVLKHSHRSSDGKTVWTNMLNDKNVTSYAEGGIDSTCGYIEKRTGNYR